MPQQYENRTKMYEDKTKMKPQQCKDKEKIRSNWLR